MLDLDCIEFPEKNGPREKWSPENWSPEKWSPENSFTRKKSPRKIGPQKICPRINVLQKLSSVKRMLENLNHFFIFIDWFHYTHKKMFDVHLTILHAPKGRTLKESRKVCCRVLGFYRLITSQHSTYTPRHSTPTPWFFVFWGPFFRDSYEAVVFGYVKKRKKICEIFFDFFLKKESVFELL